MNPNNVEVNRLPEIQEEYLTSHVPNVIENKYYNVRQVDNKWVIVVLCDDNQNEEDYFMTRWSIKYLIYRLQSLECDHIRPKNIVIVWQYRLNRESLFTDRTLGITLKSLTTLFKSTEEYICSKICKSSSDSFASTFISDKNIDKVCKECMISQRSSGNIVFSTCLSKSTLQKITVEEHAVLVKKWQINLNLRGIALTYALKASFNVGFYITLEDINRFLKECTSASREELSELRFHQAHHSHCAHVPTKHVWDLSLSDVTYGSLKALVTNIMTYASSMFVSKPVNPINMDYAYLSKLNQTDDDYYAFDKNDRELMSFIASNMVHFKTCTLENTLDFNISPIYFATKESTSVLEKQSHPSLYYDQTSFKVISDGHGLDSITTMWANQRSNMSFFRVFILFLLSIVQLSTVLNVSVLLYRVVMGNFVLTDHANLAVLFVLWYLYGRRVYCSYDACVHLKITTKNRFKSWLYNVMLQFVVIWLICCGLIFCLFIQLAYCVSLRKSHQNRKHEEQVKSNLDIAFDAIKYKRSR